MALQCAHVGRSLEHRIFFSRQWSQAGFLDGAGVAEGTAAGGGESDGEKLVGLLLLLLLLAVVVAMVSVWTERAVGGG